MKKIVFLPLVILFACRPAADKQNVGKSLSANTDNRISFKVNGEQVNTSGWNISRLTWDEGQKQWLNITTNMHEDKRTIMANLDGITSGEYSFSEDHTVKSSHGDYKPDYTGDMLKSYSFISGSFVLTEVDTIRNTVSGTFSGKVKDLQGTVLEITDGHLVNCSLKPGVTHY